MVSRRKARLLVCAFGRLPWQLVGDRSRRAIEIGERFADGGASRQELREAAKAAEDAMFGLTGLESWWQATSWRLIGGSGWLDLDEMIAAFAAQTTIDGEMVVQASRLFWRLQDGYRRSCDLIRDILGDLHHPVTINSRCLTPTVVSLAHAAYDERVMPSGELDAVRLNVLADALEETGVAGTVVDHLRGPGPHVRGCWPVDLLLAKE
jgi:hypothetical protein